MARHIRSHIRIWHRKLLAIVAIGIGVLTFMVMLLPLDPIHGQNTLTSTPTVLIPTPTLAPPSPTTTPSPTPIIVSTAESGAMLIPGQTIRGKIVDAHQNDQYVVFGRAGTTVSIGMFASTGSTLVPSIELFAPNGNKVADASAPKGALITGYTLPVTGAFVVYGHGFKNQSLGEYTLIMGYGVGLRDIDSGLVESGALYHGVVQRNGDRDVHSIDLPANATISVEALPDQSALNTVVEIIKPDGSTLFSTGGDPSGKINIDSITTEQAGRYLVRVSGFQNQTVGAYMAAITVRNTPLTPTFDLHLDKRDKVSLQQGEQYTTTFQGVPNEPVLIEAQAQGTEPFDAIIELYGPSGRRVSLADDSSPQNIDAVLQAVLSDGPGTYKIIVHGYALMPGTFLFHLKTN